LKLASEARREGQTVFMSSHILSEVQQVADRAGIVREGRLVAVDDVDELRSRAIRNVRIVFADEVAAKEFEAIDEVADLTVEGNMLTCRLVGEADAFVKRAARHQVIDFVSEEPDLEELFFVYYTGEETNAQ
jgi:ABC-2 type transport system ATP-binding protein